MSFSNLFRIEKQTLIVAFFVGISGLLWSKPTAAQTPWSFVGELCIREKVQNSDRGNYVENAMSCARITADKCREHSRTWGTLSSCANLVIDQWANYEDSVLESRDSSFDQKIIAAKIRYNEETLEECRDTNREASVICQLTRAGERAIRFSLRDFDLDGAVLRPKPTYNWMDNWLDTLK